MSAPAGLRSARWLVAGVPLAWLALLFLLPFALVLQISFAEAAPGARPPYGPLLATLADGSFGIAATLRNYALLLGDSLYASAFLGSLRFASLATLACLLLGFPLAYGIARARPSRRIVLLMLVVLPLWTSSLLRNYALIGVLKGNGLLNQVLLALGVVDAPVVILHTDLAVVIGIVYGYLPFMVLPLAAHLMRLDFTLLEAASDLGARPAVAFLRVTWPLSLPGVVAGSLLVFVPAVGEFVIPDLLGGPRSLTIGRVIWTEFFSNRDWPLACALAVAMLLLLALPLLALERARSRTAVRT